MPSRSNKVAIASGDTACMVSLSPAMLPYGDGVMSDVPGVVGAFDLQDDRTDPARCDPIRDARDQRAKTS